MNAKRFFLLLAISAASPAAAQTAAPPGAAACSGCHVPATRAGLAIPPLRGRAPDEIVTAMRAFRTGERSATVMDRIAKGFSDDEMQAIAAWYGAQR
ncbi:MAG TPA: cytochrome C [Beijerinckiaceae bacterium]|jgi:cytochrome c553